MKAKLRPERANLKPRRANLNPRRANLMLTGGTDGRTDGRTDRRLEIPPCVLQDIGPLEPLPKKNRSPKGNMWSAIPVTLLCMVVNRNKRKQGSGLKGDKVL